VYSHRYSNETICINCNDLDLIEQRIVYLLEQEGCRRLDELPPIEGRELISYEWDLRCPVIILIASSSIQSGWTVLKVSPATFFCQRAREANRPRLSTLAMELGCDAFYFGVYGGYLGILLEANTQGQTFVTGGISPDEIVENFYDEQIDSMKQVSNFELLKVLEPLDKAIRTNEDPEYLKKEAEWDRLGDLFREDPESYLSLMESYEEGDYDKARLQRIDEAMREVMGCPNKYWYSNVHYDLMYTSHLDRLPGGGKALYFDLPRSYVHQ
jgi:hypothetical protein